MKGLSRAMNQITHILSQMNTIQIMLVIIASVALLLNFANWMLFMAKRCGRGDEFFSSFFFFDNEEWWITEGINRWYILEEIAYIRTYFPFLFPDTHFPEYISNKWHCNHKLKMIFPVELANLTFHYIC